MTKTKKLFALIFLPAALLLSGNRVVNHAGAPAGPPATNLVEQLDAATLTGSDASDISTLTATVGTNATSVAAHRPKLYNAVKNGKNIARFDGTAAYLITANFGSAIAQPYTMFVVFKSAEDTGSYWIVDGNSDANRGTIATNGSMIRFYAGGADWIFGPYFGDLNWHILSVEFNGASSKYRLDGGTETTFSATPGAGGIQGICIGIDSSLDAVFTPMDFGEILIYTGSIADKTTHFSYLNTKWAVY